MIDKMLINVSGEVKQEDIIKASETKEYYINLNKKNKNKNKSLLNLILENLLKNNFNLSFIKGFTGGHTSQAPYKIST